MRAISATLLGAILLLTAPALAQGPRDEHKVTLRAIMQELQTEFRQMTNALLVEDFAALQQSAKAIRGHPMPSEIVD